MSQSEQAATTAAAELANLKAGCGSRAGKRSGEKVIKTPRCLAGSAERRRLVILAGLGCLLGSMSSAGGHTTGGLGRLTYVSHQMDVVERWRGDRGSGWVQRGQALRDSWGRSTANARERAVAERHAHGGDAASDRSVKMHKFKRH